LQPQSPATAAKSSYSRNFSKTFRAVGLFKLGSTFAADSNLISSDSTAIQLAYRQINTGEISMGLIRLAPGADLGRIQLKLKQMFGS